MKIPTNNQWTQDPDSDIFGDLQWAFNLDLSLNKGHTTVSPRMVIGTDNISNLGIPIGFERFNGGSGQNGFFCVAGDRAFSSNGVDASAVFAVSSGSATTHSADTADIMFFRKANLLVTSMQTTLQSQNGTSWSSVGGTPLVSGTPHVMTEYANRGYVTDNYKTVISFDTSMNTTAAGNPNTFSLGTLNLNSIGLMFTKILGAADRIWLFTLNLAVGQPARTYSWDGATQDTPIVGQGYVMDSGGVLAAVLIDDSPFVMNVEGRLQEFNGGSFVDVENGRLPFDRRKFLQNSFSSVNDRWIHPNGMKVLPGKRIQILINNVYEDGTIEEGFASGFWEFDLNNKALGWYHLNSFSLYTNAVTDYGQNRLSRVGGFLYAKTATGSGIRLAGAQIYSDVSSTKQVIATENTAETIQKYGYFVTTKIYSGSIDDSWGQISLRFKKLLAASDSIVIKYRTTDLAPSEVTITWTSTSGFTSTGDLSAYGVGDEVEVIQGKGSGKCAHITAISVNAGTYTVTLDDTFTGASSGTAKARLQKWTKLASIADQTIQQLMVTIAGSTNNSVWIQFKVCLQFTGKNEFDDLILLNSAHQLAQ